MSDAELSGRIVDAEQAKAALEQYLAPAFDLVTEAYTRRLIEVAAAKPGETAPIINLAMAVKIAGEVRKHIEALVLDGKMARSELDRVRQIERMSPEARRYA